MATLLVIKDRFYPVIQFHTVRMAAKKLMKAEKISGYHLEEYALLVSREELDQI